MALALDGDTTALRLCFDRLMPPRRERLAPIAMPQTRDAGDLTPAVGLARLVDVFVKGARHA
jgi:hypothetical protein